MNLIEIDLPFLVYVCMYVCCTVWLCTP